ncbi:MAG: Holliday junction branch migration protein RuvA [Endomicrobium sp.]|jgi:Holliday junction DNA helicase RuvA|nr:Holliday junction branch migration protein RuvA [Endomicrobium sp.]
MIDYLYGTFNSKLNETVIIDVNGIGYKIFVPLSSIAKFPSIDNFVKIYIVESTNGIYGGTINLYGFITKEERDMYLLIKEEVPGIGAKKAFEYMNKISVSFKDFKIAILFKNFTILRTFGFTKKTSDKLIAALKNKISTINVSDDKNKENKIVSETIASLMALGYKKEQAKLAVNTVYEQYNDNIAVTLEDLIKKSLQHLYNL